VRRFEDGGRRLAWKKFCGSSLEEVAFP